MTARETIETQGWSDRELQLRTYYQTVETNGTVRMHTLELYGNGSGHEGLCQRLRAVEDGYIQQDKFQASAKLATKVAYLIGGTLVAGIFTVVGLLLTVHL